MAKPKEIIVLVLQGGGALGAYQAGAVECLTERGYAPDWVAGISIGAINAAIIAGNEPDKRIERLEMFWDRCSSALSFSFPVWGNRAASLVAESAAASVLMTGVPGFVAYRRHRHEVPLDL